MGEIVELSQSSSNAWGFWLPFLAGVGVGCVVAFFVTVVAMLLLYGFHSEVLGRNFLVAAETDIHGLIKRSMQRLHLSIHVHDEDHDPANWWKWSEKNDDGSEDDFGGYLGETKKPKQ